MSRTDKDRPNWVVRHVENHPIEHDHRHGDCIEQTLTFDPRATCEPARSDGTDRHPQGRFGPDAEEIHRFYYVPERRRERDELHRLLRAWNAGDPLDDYDFANHQHRHSVHWLM